MRVIVIVLLAGFALQSHASGVPFDLDPVWMIKRARENHRREAEERRGNTPEYRREIMRQEREYEAQLKRKAQQRAAQATTREQRMAEALQKARQQSSEP